MCPYNIGLNLVKFASKPINSKVECLIDLPVDKHSSLLLNDGLGSRFGRKSMMLICLYTQCTIGLVLHFVSSLVVFISLRFIQGIFIQVLPSGACKLTKFSQYIRKDCFQVKSNLLTDFRFTTHMNIMILN
jgi:hypothetical protein